VEKQRLAEFKHGAALFPFAGKAISMCLRMYPIMTMANDQTSRICIAVFSSAANTDALLRPKPQRPQLSALHQARFVLIAKTCSARIYWLISIPPKLRYSPVTAKFAKKETGGVSWLKFELSLRKIRQFDNDFGYPHTPPHSGDTLDF